MLRFLYILLVCICAVYPAAAQIVDIGQNDNPKKKEAKIEAGSEVAKDATESRGMFSFMKKLDFGFGSKDDKVEGVANDKVAEICAKAEDGDIDSQILLGYMYLYGEGGVDVDYDKAFEYYVMAAAQEDKVALNNLGSLFYSGIGVKRDAQKAAALFAKSAELGNSEAGINLAFIYMSGMGLPQDYNKALQFFEKSAEDGNPTAKFMLGYAYFRGFVVEKDLRKAFELMKDAADFSYDDAQYMVARMYMNGEGTPKNYGNMVKYYTAAANQGHVQAMTELGVILVQGVMYNKNIYQAHILFNVATVLGDNSAAEKRDALEKVLKIDELLQAQSEAEAFRSKPSELTEYIKNTFGERIRIYIEDGISSTSNKKSR